MKGSMSLQILMSGEAAVADETLEWLIGWSAMDGGSNG